MNNLLCALMIKKYKFDKNTCIHNNIVLNKIEYN